jgi:hypothetical protein
MKKTYQRIAEQIFSFYRIVDSTWKRFINVSFISKCNLKNQSLSNKFTGATDHKGTRVQPMDQWEIRIQSKSVPYVPLQLKSLP